MNLYSNALTNKHRERARARISIWKTKSDRGSCLINKHEAHMNKRKHNREAFAYFRIPFRIIIIDNWNADKFR